jgi:hypothetical protein
MNAMKKMFLTAIMAICVMAGFSQSAQPAQGSKTASSEKNERDLPNGLDRANALERNIVKAYPNPSSGSITIEGFVVNARSKYQLRDATGRTVASGTITAENATLDISHLLNGMYFLTFTGEHESVTIRLVKQ